MTKLSSREKLLLYLLIVVLAAVAGWFLIKPALDETAELDNSISEAEIQKADMEQVILTRPAYAESLETSRKRIETLKGEFLPLMTNDDLDRYITGLMQKNGLVAASLLISPSEQTASSYAVLKLNVLVEATGERDQMISLIQQLSKEKGIRIATLAVKDNGEKTRSVPLTPEEIAALKAAGKAVDTKKKADAKKTDDKTPAVPSKEVKFVEYGVSFGFEAIEFDEELFAAMGG